MQRAEMEELRQRDANLTALQAIGPRKKPKLEGDTVLPAGVREIGDILCFQVFIYRINLF